mgnify:FL=1
MKWIFLIFLMFIFSCSSSQNLGMYDKTSKISSGSAVSKNVFTDISQFSNKTVKVKIRNTSGDFDINKSKLKQRLQSGLIENGFKVDESKYDFVIDLNVYSFQSVSQGKKRPSSGIGLLLGGVVGSEIGRRNNSITQGSRIILGAVAGTAIESILKNSSDSNTYFMLADFNIGWIQKDNNQDSISVGGLAVENNENKNNSKFKKMSDKGTVKIAVYGGSKVRSKQDVLKVLEDRLILIVNNIL